VGSYKLTKSSLMRISYSQRLHNLKQSFSAVRTNRQINLTCSIVLWPEYLTLVQSFTLLLSISYSVVSLRWSSHVYIWAAHGGMCYVLWVSWLGAKEYIFSKKGAKNMFWACSLVLTYASIISNAGLVFFLHVICCLENFILILIRSRSLDYFSVVNGFWSTVVMLCLRGYYLRATEIFKVQAPWNEIFTILSILMKQIHFEGL